MEKTFPIVLIVLDFCAGAVYAHGGDIRHAVYWIAARILTICVTF